MHDSYNYIPDTSHVCRLYYPHTPTATAVSLHKRPNSVLTLAIAECLRKLSRSWHAPAVLRCMSAQATGSAHKQKKKNKRNRKQILVRIAEDRGIPRACAERGCQPADRVLHDREPKPDGSTMQDDTSATHEQPSVAVPRKLEP